MLQWEIADPAAGPLPEAHAVPVQPRRVSLDTSPSGAAMGELVPLDASRKLAIVPAAGRDPEQAQAEQEKRIEEAQALEAKLKVIQESVPTRTYNTCSSSAGAGSSDFHLYRLIRKTEQERWKRIEAMDQEQKEKEAFELKRKAAQEAADAKTAKNRAKRQKKKAKAKSGKPGGGGGNGGSGAGEDSASEQEHEETVPQVDLD